MFIYLRQHWQQAEEKYFHDFPLRWYFVVGSEKKERRDRKKNVVVFRKKEEAVMGLRGRSDEENFFSFPSTSSSSSPHSIVLRLTCSSCSWCYYTARNDDDFLFTYFTRYFIGLVFPPRFSILFIHLFICEKISCYFLFVGWVRQRPLCDMRRGLHVRFRIGFSCK